MGSIELNGDFGGGYGYSYSHKIVYAFGETKELAFKNTLQKIGMLELGKFAGLYCDRSYLDAYYPDDRNEQKCEKSYRFNQFMEQKFPEVKVYRLANDASEDIYILGQVNTGDLVGLYLSSSFVYNP